jgi:hypothetical protein
MSIARSDARMAPGQALVLIALILPVLVAFVMTAVEAGTRVLQRAEVEDALRQATRTAVQTWEYETFAHDTVAVRPVALIAVGQRNMVTNLQGVHGLVTTPEQTAAAVIWTPIMDPATEHCTDPHGRIVTFTSPGVCATLTVRMQGFIGWGEWQPQIFVAETLDLIKAP